MNKTALITGASSGIGYELAKIFLNENYSLILVAKDEGRLNSVRDELMAHKSSSIRTIIIDLSEPEAASKIYDDVKAHEGRLDVLVNNAGFGTFGLFTDIENSSDFKMLEVNISTLTKLTKFFVKDMREVRAGKILNVASTAAFQPGPLMAVYFASKAYVLSFSEALHNELKEFGITVTVLCPGPTQTSFEHNAHMEKSGLFQGRLMHPAQVARAGYRALMNGKDIVIPGFNNKITAFMTRFLPMRLTARLVRGIQSRTRV